MKPNSYSKIRLLGVVSYVSNNGPGSLSKWQEQGMFVLNSKGNQISAVYEGRGIISASESLGYDLKPDDLTQDKVKR